MPFLLSVILSFLPALGYASIVYWLDRFEKEPGRLLGGVFTWGALVATLGAIIWSMVFQFSIYMLTGSEVAAEMSGTALVAPLVEESLKGMAVLIIFLAFRTEFDSILDGIVYASITALGFAATENVLYLYFQGYQEDGMGGLVTLFILRVLMGGWNHAVYTSFIGIGLAMSRLSRRSLVIFGAPALGWGIAVATHATHNGMAILIAKGSGLSGLLALFLVDWLGWLAVFGIILWAMFRERRWMTDYLREEVDRGVISAEQYQTARSIWGRMRARSRARRSEQRRATKRFYQLCAELAQKKHQLKRRGEERGNSATIKRLRAELARISPQAAT